MDHIGAAFASRTMICRIFSVYLPLTELPGVGRKTGKGLYAAGTRTREDIVAATLERLSEVPESATRGPGNCRHSAVCNALNDNGRKLDASEILVQKHLAHRCFKSVVYEPDGNIPPDFVVDGTIAIEVRRLNQNYFDGVQTKGLEEVAIPLWQKIENLVYGLGPPNTGESWFVCFRFGRPVESWKTLGPKIRSALLAFSQRAVGQNGIVFLDDTFEVEVLRAEHAHPTMYVMGGSSDRESGAWVLSEMATNIRHCAAQKTEKIAAVRGNYSEWWLALVDYIGYGLDNFDREMFRDEILIEHDWDKILIIDPRDPTRYFEI